MPTTGTADHPGVRLTTRLLRKDPRLPAYVVIPGRPVQLWGLDGTTVVEGTANGIPFGRRTIKAWSNERDDWFVEFTARFCEEAGIAVGDRVTLEIRLADTSTPEELERILSGNDALTAAWRAWSESERRLACEHVRAAKRRATRERRAAAIAERLRCKASS